ncbi:hypothetical protein [Saccharopolyspora shandongensis]|uniref:hypothetical protein n=1 Tax=Saccharopolyspora shandongensis TaxID=418495 RepID=UPI0033C175BD
MAEYVAKQLDFELEHRKLINERGHSMIRNASALFALFFSAATIVTGIRVGQGYFPWWITLWGFVLTLIAFAFAVFLGIRATRTVTALVVSPEALTRQSIEDGGGKEIQRWITEKDIKILTSMRTGNNEKTSTLEKGLYAELVALCVLALAVISVHVHAIFPSLFP